MISLMKCTHVELINREQPRQASRLRQPATSQIQQVELLRPIVGQ
ncbi:MAG: hypothetical protein RL171_1502, partial [Pseudomonadota bacterium]